MEDNAAQAPVGGAILQWEQGSQIAVVQAWGEIDLANLSQFQETLDQAVAADVAVIVDMSRVAYMDSSGFGALLETSRVARPLGIAVYLAGCTENITRMLEITRLNRVFQVMATLEAARTTAAAGALTVTA